MEIYLIRHTKPKVGKGICYGQTDLEIDETSFEQELNFISKNLPKDIEKIFSSPLKRCGQLAEKLKVDFSTDKRLMELNFGDWENKNWNEIDKTQLNEWMQDFVNISPPNGENYKDLHLRTESYINDVLKTDLQKIAIITHAGNIRSFLSFVLSLPLENSFRIRLDYATVVVVTMNESENFNQLVSIQQFQEYE
jgi:alpha-ribazole phosphatase